MKPKRVLIATILASLFTFAMSTPAFATAEEDFNKNCASCHGKDGKGKTTMGAKLKIKDLTDAKVQGEFTDAKAEQDITDGIKDAKTGKKLMPARKGKLSADQIKELVKYVRSLKAK